MAAAAKSSIEEITHNDSSMKIVVKVGDKVIKETNYVIGQEFEDNDPAGNLWKCTGKWKGDVLEIHARNEDKDWILVVAREIENNEMVVRRSLTQGSSTVSSTGRFQKV